MEKTLLNQAQVLAVQACRELSLSLKNQRDWEGALQATDDALAICPSIADLCASRIDLLGRLQRDEEAARYLQSLPAAVQDSAPLVHARINALNATGRFDEARQILRTGVHRAMAMGEPDFAIINEWLTQLVSSGSSGRELETELDSCAACLPEDIRYQGLIASYAMIRAWLAGEAGAVLTIAGQHTSYEALPDIDTDRAMRVFYRYLRQLALAQRAAQSATAAPAAMLQVLGESHCLAPANSVFPWHGQLVRACGRFIMGVQMHHLARAGENVYKQRVRSHLHDMADGPLLLTIGEIDCRPVEGLWRTASRGGVPLDQMMDATVNGYFSFLDQVLCQRAWPSVTIQGVPAPGYDLTDRRDPGDKPAFIAMIRRVNSLLAAGARRRHWHFLDIHSATARQDGLGNGLWHLDRYHLSPSFYQHAMQWMVTATPESGTAAM